MRAYVKKAQDWHTLYLLAEVERLDAEVGEFRAALGKIAAAADILHWTEIQKIAREVLRRIKP